MIMMKFGKYMPLLMAAVMGIAFTSCHKDKKDDTTAKLYLNGSVKFNIPTYVRPGDIYELTPSGVSTKEHGSVGYVWKVPSVSEVSDTTRKQNDPVSVDGTYRFRVPNKPGSTTITCTAFADGYYNSTKTVTIVIVSSQESLTGATESGETGVFVDSRDRRKYSYVTIGGTDWMSENLRYMGGYDFDNAVALRDIFGGYYSWNEAAEACPEGWRLPDKNDWASFYASVSGNEPAEDLLSTFEGISGKMMVDARFNDDRLWEFWPDVKITGESGFRALPFGYGIVGENYSKFDGYKEYAIWWTADLCEEAPDKAYYRYIYKDKGDLFLGNAGTDSFVANVRCVR